MIGFASLFLGLILGVQPVQLIVGDGVAAAEVLLDGRSLGVIRGEPWTVLCDLGPELVPHELVAVALDAEGREIDRATQWINLPSDPAGASAVLEGGADGEETVVRLIWDSIVAAEPESVSASFDGELLEIEDPSRIHLPAHDPRQLHFFQAELDFADHVSYSVEMTFGGLYADEVQTELTAIPVVFHKRARLPAAEELEGWFLKGKDPLRVVAVEEGPAELVVVRDPATQEGIDRLGRQQAAVSANRPLFARERAARSLRSLLPLGKEHRLRFIWPFFERREHGARRYELTPPTRDYNGLDGGLYWLLSIEPPPSSVEGPQRLADAVAVAGLVASGRNHRRAVVLITTATPAESSRLEPTAARSYLEHLRVPLFVWSTEAGEALSAAGWGEPAEITSLSRLERAFRQLMRSLEHQRIVWLEGVHLPQQVTLSPTADGLTLAR